nr:NADP-specific glutamate dehydrogenase [Tanacetum cinerariifolium]
TTSGIPLRCDFGGCYINQTLGPCKGGLHFHPLMNLRIVKFLVFQQTLRTALSP